ncbi:hypothetical protein B0H14DRAFT_3173187 [Mycena olivaceomarginata]|nr:hypothetical protein B0H14DRAFT_3173187 [Mycena olivaceomarginata]
MSCGLKKSLPSFKQALKARTHKSQVVKFLTLTFLRLFRVDVTEWARVENWQTRTREYPRPPNPRVDPVPVSKPTGNIGVLATSMRTTGDMDDMDPVPCMYTTSGHGNTGAKTFASLDGHGTEMSDQGNPGTAKLTGSRGFPFLPGWPAHIPIQHQHQLRLGTRERRGNDKGERKTGRKTINDKRRAGAGRGGLYGRIRIVSCEIRDETRRDESRGQGGGGPGRKVGGVGTRTENRSATQREGKARRALGYLPSQHPALPPVPAPRPAPASAPRRAGTPPARRNAASQRAQEREQGRRLHLRLHRRGARAWAGIGTSTPSSSGIESSALVFPAPLPLPFVGESGGGTYAVWEGGGGPTEPRADERERFRGGIFRLSGDKYRLAFTLTGTRTRGRARMGLGRPLELLAPRVQPADAPLHPPYALLERRERVLDVRVQRVLPVGQSQLRHRELEARDLRAEGGELRLLRVDLGVEGARARDDARDELAQRAEGGRETEEGSGEPGDRDGRGWLGAGGRGRRGEGGRGAQEGDAEEGGDEAEEEEAELESAEGGLGAGGAAGTEGGDVGGVGVGVTRGGRIQGPGDCGASVYDICTSTKARTFDNLMEIKDEQEEQEEVLDVVAACEPVADGRRQREEHGDGGLVPRVRGGRVVVVLFVFILVLLVLPRIPLVACGCLGPAPRILVIIPRLKRRRRRLRVVPLALAPKLKLVFVVLGVPRCACSTRRW